MSNRDNKRYYWLKLHKDFFTSKRIKKLRNMNSDYLIVYLKMQLSALETDGIINIIGLENNYYEEIALDIDEDPNVVKDTLDYLTRCGLANVDECGHIVALPFVKMCTGSETGGAERKRKYKENSDFSKSKGGNFPQGGGNFPPEIEKEIEKEIDIKKEIKKVSKSERFTPPTLEEIKQYIKDKNYSVNAECFFNYYESNGWMVGKNKMKNWKCAVSNWNTRDKSNRDTWKTLNKSNFHEREYDHEALEKMLIKNRM